MLLNFMWPCLSPNVTAVPVYVTNQMEGCITHTHTHTHTHIYIYTHMRVHHSPQKLSMPPIVLSVKFANSAPVYQCETMISYKI
jgi:hypothetical protein